MEAVLSSETSLLTRATNHIPENGIIYSQSREDLTYYRQTLSETLTDNMNKKGVIPMTFQLVPSV
jgi:hypothetical protein